jgi:16S rRNA (cytosine967-C5)-methyltransferase
MTRNSSDPTRQSAFDLLLAVAEQRRTLEDALDDLPAVDARDRAAAHRIAATVLRRQGTLDAVLEPFLTRSPPERVRLILRIGAAGLLFLDTPAHAAVGTAVALARARRLEPFAGLVNAVLRRVARDGVSALVDLDAPRLDTPGWLWTAWGDRARAIAIAHQHEAPLDLTLRPGATPPEGATLLPNGTARLEAGTRVTELPGFDDGDFWVQDAAASLPARLLDARAGERVCDLCAAPGGKTAQLALTGAAVTALDRDAARLRRLRENMTRLGLAPDIVEADALDWTPDEPFDAILLDAPCSATGTARRHPDMLRLRRPQDIAILVERQRALLAASARLLRPGGRLVYATCSLQPEEGRAIIEHALGNGPWRLSPIASDETSGLADAVTPDGMLRTDPGMAIAMDGFFAARLVSTAS